MNKIKNLSYITHGTLSYVIRCRKGLDDLQIRQIVFQQFEDVC